MNFRNPGTGFSRDRKLTFDETVEIILSMDGNTISTEILEYFDFDVSAI